jgi:CRP-like cAMP-binding protein
LSGTDVELPVLRTLASGDILFYEGDIGESAYVVESGVIEIRHFKDESYITLAELKEGTLFGEIALIDKRPRSATAITTSDAVVREINKANFLEYLESSPDVAFEIMQRLAGYARNASQVLLQARITACLQKVQQNEEIGRTLKVFISSPGDVIPERRIAKRVMGQLNKEFSGQISLIPILWEEEPLLASETFQAQIEAPHETDLYVGILWSRIGSPLPESILRTDGTRYDSGTAFEFEDAMNGCQKKGTPEMLLYRKLGAPTMSLDQRDQVMERLKQMELLDQYINKWFVGEDGSYIGAFHNFETEEDFGNILETHLRKLVQTKLKTKGE